MGQELYRILYDQLTFNLNGGRLDADKLPRQEAPVLFEVMSDNPGDVRCEIRVSTNAHLRVDACIMIHFI